MDAPDPGSGASASREALDRVVREDWGRLIALLVAATRRLDLVEDALADAVEKAARSWPADGVPATPAAWLLTAARRRVIDVIRAEAIHARKHRQLVSDAPSPPQVAELALADADQDVLRLLLLAAHPSLSLESGAALTLRLVIGLTTTEIAHLFLAAESAMAARLTRAKKKVVAAGIPLILPPEQVIDQRLDVIAQIAYLVFTAGYAPSQGDQVVEVERAETAIRIVALARRVSKRGAEHPALMALQALMELHHARRDARSIDGSLVLLAEQDRERWHWDEIDHARALLDRLVPPGGGAVAAPSQLAASYLVQALIAREHVRSEGPDWVVIADLYLQLDRITGSPVVRMNRAVAVAEAGDPPAGSALLAGIEDELAGSHRYWAVRAELSARQGRTALARTELGRALTLCHNGAEREALEQRRSLLL